MQLSVKENVSCFVGGKGGVQYIILQPLSLLMLRLLLLKAQDQNADICKNHPRPPKIYRLFPITPHEKLG